MKTIVTSRTPLLRALYVILLLITALWTMPGSARAQVYVSEVSATGRGAVQEYDPTTGALITPT